MGKVCASIALLAGRSNPGTQDKVLTCLIMAAWLACAMHGTWLNPVARLNAKVKRLNAEAKES
jgi:hypothetical protein